MAYEKLIETVDITITSGNASGSASITPRAGLVIGCSIYQNDAANSGIVKASFKTDSGEEIVPAVPIKDFRSREAGYREGLMPLYLETSGKTFFLNVSSDQNFTADFKATLVLVYEKNFTKDNC